MNFFDLHCDTIGVCGDKNIPLLKNNLHIDLQRCAEIESYTQVFAIWIPDELRGESAKAYFDKTADYFYSELEANYKHISRFGDEKKTPVKAILSVEGGSACGGTLEGLHHLYNRGVRIITLTWNAVNEIASGAFSDGGFTDFGKAFVKEAEKLGIVLDVSHLNRQSFFEFLEISEKPFIASHSNADIVNNIYAEKRNLTKEQILCIKEREGLIGLNFCLDFIENQGVSGIDALCEQIDYFLSLGCEDILVFGSDYDGCEIHKDLCGIEKIPSVYDALRQKGYNRKFLNKIFYKNALRFFKSV